MTEAEKAEAKKLLEMIDEVNAEGMKTTKEKLYSEGIGERLKL